MTAHLFLVIIDAKNRLPALPQILRVAIVIGSMVTIEKMELMCVVISDVVS